MPSDIAIEVQGLSKAYSSQQKPLRQIARLLFNRRTTEADAFQALHPMDFKLYRGETLGIIGRNGAGKSTLLQLICGTLSPTTGHIVRHGKVAALLELGAGFNPEFTGRENIYLSAAVYGLEQRQVAERLQDIIDFAQIGEHIEQPVKTYSSGMFVRLAFAVIAHVDADILVIDEALSVGDVYFTQKCMRFLKDFSARGTLLFVSHDTHSVSTLCQRALWIDQGRVRMLDGSKQVVDAYLASFYTSQDADSSAAGGDQPRAAVAPAGQRTADRMRGNNNFSSAFGQGGGEILACTLLDEQDQPLLLQDAAQQVTLQVDCLAHVDIERPIVGFYIKDRLGQPVCGFNSLVHQPDWALIAAGSRAQVRFGFWLPLLATGNYTITVALAAGTQLDHVQHHWVHDILSFKASADPHLSGIFTLQQTRCQVLPE